MVCPFHVHREISCLASTIREAQKLWGLFCNRHLRSRPSKLESTCFGRGIPFRFGGDFFGWELFKQLGTQDRRRRLISKVESAEFAVSTGGTFG